MIIGKHAHTCAPMCLILSRKQAAWDKGPAVCCPLTPQPATSELRSAPCGFLFGSVTGFRTSALLVPGTITRVRSESVSESENHTQTPISS